MPYKTPTLKELAPIIEDYRAAFPEWQLVNEDVLIRFGTWVAQSIWFDRLRSGTYRPTCGVHVLVAPSSSGCTGVMTQFLNIKQREIRPEAHVRVFQSVIIALKSEIYPSLEKPLNELEVIDAVKKNYADRPAAVYALACLLGALGRSNETLQWIDKYHSALARLKLVPQSIDVERDTFLRKVEEWLKQPEREANFADVAEQQKALLLGGHEINR
jgi:hypothetical protein